MSYNRPLSRYSNGGFFPATETELAQVGVVVGGTGLTKAGVEVPGTELSQTAVVVVQTELTQGGVAVGRL